MHLFLFNLLFCCHFMFILLRPISAYPFAVVVGNSVVFQGIDFVHILWHGLTGDFFEFIVLFKGKLNDTL